MFRTVPLSIIRSFSLYTQQWYMSYRVDDSLLSNSCPVQLQFIVPYNLLTSNYKVVYQEHVIKPFSDTLPNFTTKVCHNGRSRRYYNNNKRAFQGSRTKLKHGSANNIWDAANADNPLFAL